MLSVHMAASCFRQITIGTVQKSRVRKVVQKNNRATRTGPNSRPKKSRYKSFIKNYRHQAFALKSGAQIFLY